MRSFNVFNAEFAYDDADPRGYRAGSHRFGPRIGASRMGATVYELPPGQALCPYHYESEEEWLLVLHGQVTLRHPDGEDLLGPGDITAFPVGPAGAHKTINNGEVTVRMVMFATVDPVGYCVYPDSDKISFWGDSPDERDRSVRVRRGETLPYYEGEV